MNRVVLFFTALYLAACDAKPSPTTLTFDGLGPVKLGMNFDDMQKALGKTLRPRASDEEPACWYTQPADSTTYEVAYMMNGTQVRRIDVRTHAIATPEGAKVGAGQDDVVKLYGGRIKVELSKYLGPEDGNDLVVHDPAGKSRVIFQTQKSSDNRKVVQNMRVGLSPEVDYVEGCS